MYLFVFLHGPGGQQLLRLLQTGGGDIQADAEAGKAVDDLAGPALAVVILEAGDTVGRQQGNDGVGIGGESKVCFSSTALSSCPASSLGHAGTSGRPVKLQFSMG